MVQFASYLRRVLCKTRLIFPRINGPINSPIKNVGQRLRALLWMFATSLGVNDSVNEII